MKKVAPKKVTGGNSDIYLYTNAISAKSSDFYFLLPISRESIVFRSNFRNGEFDGFTCFEVK